MALPRQARDKRKRKKTQQRGALRFAGEYTVAVRNPAQMEGRLDGYVDKARPRVTTVQIVPARRPVSPTRLIDVSDYLPAGFPAGGLDWATVREPKNNSTPFSRHFVVQTDRMPRQAQDSHDELSSKGSIFRRQSRRTRPRLSCPPWRLLAHTVQLQTDPLPPMAALLRPPCRLCAFRGANGSSTDHWIFLQTQRLWVPTLILRRCTFTRTS
jgi:hypothetical protein